MMPDYNDLEATKVIERIVVHEMTLKDKEELHCQSSSSAYKATSDTPNTSSGKLKDVSGEELGIMVRNFNKFYKNKFKDREATPSQDMASQDLPIMMKIAKVVDEPDISHQIVQLLPKEKVLYQERKEGVTMIEMREDLGDARGQTRRTSTPRDTPEKFTNNNKWVYCFESDDNSQASYHSTSEYSEDEGVAGIALTSIKPKCLFNSPK